MVKGGFGVSRVMRRAPGGMIHRVPPIVVNVPSAPGLPAWVAPLVGFIGVLVGLVGNNVLTRSREQSQFVRDKKMELYLELQNGEYEIRRWLPLTGPVEPDWITKNAQWASLQLRMAMFASREVEDLGNRFWDGVHDWLVLAARASSDGHVGIDDRATLERKADEVLALHGELFTALRQDLGVSPWRARHPQKVEGRHTENH